MEKSTEATVVDVQPADNVDAEKTSLSASGTFRRAVKAFLGGLPEKTKQDVKNPFLRTLVAIDKSEEPPSTASDGESYVRNPIESLKQCLENLEDKRQTKRVHRVIEKITPFLKRVEPVTKVLEPLGSAGPMGTGVIFSGARLVLTMAIDFHEFFESLLEALIIIADNLRVYEMQNTTFHDEPDIQNRLVRSYGNILSFWHLASQKLLNTSSKTFNLVISKEMEEAKTRFRDDMNAINDLSKAHTDRRQRMDSIRQWLVAGQAGEIDFRRDQTCNRQAHQSGTCEWILEDPRFVHWRDSKHQSVLWYNAPPGSGKTVLTSTVIDHLQKRGEKVAYFFFSFNDNLRKHGINGFSCLIIQLLYVLASHVSQSFFAICLEEMKLQPRGLASAGLAARLISELTKSNDFYVVFDGLDECVDMDLPSSSLLRKHDMLEDLEDMVRGAKVPFGGGKWFFTSRKQHSKIDLSMRRIAATEIEADAAVIARDVQTYLSANIYNVRLAKEYAQTEASFLYAGLLCHALRGKKVASLWDVENELHFPKSLNGYFNRSLERIAKHSKHKQKFVQRLFSLLVTSEQSLTFDEVIGALSVDHDAGDYDERKRVEDGRELIKELCGPLVELDPVVRFCHKSVSDYLQQDPTEEGTELIKPIHKFFVHDSRKASRDLGMGCLAYLMYKPYHRFQPLDSLLDEECQENSFLRYAAIFWFQHLLDIDPTPDVRERVETFLRSKAFWTCLSVQSKVAPFLFGFYSHRKAGSFSMGSRGHEYFGDDSFGVPLPNWLDGQFQHLDQSFCCFVRDWREVLATCPMALRHCCPLREFPKARSCHLTPLAEPETRKPRVISLEEVLPLSSITAIYAFELGFEGRRPLVNLLFSGDSDAAEGVQQLKVPIHGKLKGAAIESQSHKVPVTKTGGSFVYFIVSGAGQGKVEKWYVNLETLEIGPVLAESNILIRPSPSPIRQRRRQHPFKWHLVGNSRIYAPSGSSIQVLHLNSKGLEVCAKAHDSETGGDGDSGYNSSPSTDSSSDEEESFSDDYGSEDDVDSDVSRPPDREHACEGEKANTLNEQSPATAGSQEKDARRMAFIRSGKAPVVVSCMGASGYWDNDVAAMHPELPLVALTHSPDELELINMDAGGERERIPLPPSETAGNPAARSRELRFSSCGKYLHLLVLLFFVKEYSTRCVVELRTFLFTQEEDDSVRSTIRQLRSRGCSFTIQAPLGQASSPLALTSWADDYVIVALPPLTCNPKVLRMDIATGGGDVLQPDSAPDAGGDSNDIFVLREQIYFPTPTPQRNPSLGYRSMKPGSDGLYLVLGPILPEPETDGIGVQAQKAASQRSYHASPPVVLRWTISRVDGWRPWDVEVDQKRSEQVGRQEMLERLRGSFVDDRKSFTAPVRCGLNWTRKGVLTCS
ncbi:hypothetical protein LX36DRAFT_750538 [Colletotrichum falcatum]|nr:hypothetical protein LX36DRAFT_750538 [Colletotrichum falcatum]